MGAAVDPAARSEAESLIRQLKDAAKGDNAADIRRLSESLSQAAQAITAAVYQNAQSPQRGAGDGPDTQETGPSGAQPRGDENVVEAEYQEVA